MGICHSTIKTRTGPSMSRKHEVGYDLFKATKELGYIVKVDGTAKYKWVKNKPTKLHLNRIILLLNNSRESSKRKKRVIKLFWGLITYEK